MATATCTAPTDAPAIDIPEWTGYGVGPSPYRLLTVIEATYPPDRDGKPDARSGEQAEALGVVLGECAICEVPIERHYVIEAADGSRRCVCRQCLEESGAEGPIDQARRFEPSQSSPSTAEPEAAPEPCAEPILTAEPPSKPKRKAKPAQPNTCRLSLQIRDTTYTVRPASNEAHRDGRAWRLGKPDGGHYHVAETDHGPTCDCADWTFRREHLDPDGCKHIRALRACGLIAKPLMREETFR